MASVRKLKSKRFLVEVRKHGQRLSKTFDTQIQAYAWAAETENTLTPNGIVKGKILGDAFSRYRDEISPTKKSHRNEHNRMNRLLQQPIANLVILETTNYDIELWIEKALKRNKNSSVNRDLNAISAVFEQAKRWRWTDRNPLREIKRPKNPQPRDRRISEREIERILDALGFDGETVATRRDVIAVAFLFALETAMRQGEIWGLTWNDIYFDKRYARLHETKNGTKRDVPLSSEAIRLLKLLPSHNDRVFNTNQNSSATLFRRSLKLASIKGLTFHDTRHEALTRLARKLEVLDLARMVGHRDPRSLMIYYNATAEEIAHRLG